MSAGAKAEPRSTVARLAFTIAGVLLMIAPPFVFNLLKLTSSFQNVIIAGIELPVLVAGFVLLYFCIRQPGSPKRGS